AKMGRKYNTWMLFFNLLPGGGVLQRAPFTQPLSHASLLTGSGTGLVRFEIVVKQTRLYYKVCWLYNKTCCLYCKACCLYCKRNCLYCKMFCLLDKHGFTRQPSYTVVICFQNLLSLCIWNLS